jgi:hypothetical protein
MAAAAILNFSKCYYSVNYQPILIKFDDPCSGSKGQLENHETGSAVENSRWPTPSSWILKNAITQSNIDRF